jgi:hypothetical protein
LPKQSPDHTDCQLFINVYKTLFVLSQLPTDSLPLLIFSKYSLESEMVNSFEVIKHECILFFMDAKTTKKAI